MPALHTNEATQSAWAMEQAGVPPSAILVVANSESTFDDARLTREEMERHGWRSAIVISDPFHLRRVSLVFTRAFRGSGLTVTYHAPPRNWFSTDHWWQRRKDTVQVLLEYIKLTGYLVQGRLF